MNKIDFNGIQSLKHNGFEGFKTIQELIQPNNAFVPKDRGVYLVIRPFDFNPNFLIESIGGYFKGINPSVDICKLKNKWIDNTKVLYIGKAGNVSNKSTLKSRTRSYLKFGSGQKTGHWGGRYIWQIENSGLLQICWKPLQNENPRDAEKELILQFEKTFGRLPFANLCH